MNEREIFAETMQLPSGSQREAFLARACGSDEPLRRRIEELIAEQGRLGSFLERSAAPPPADPAATMAYDSVERPGSQIGPYKLLQVIGEGGMGVVYMAEQHQPVLRRVALKIIKPGMDTRQVIARFEAERQSLAMMDHPSIAKVFDAGATATGRPYFVMELVKGVPITQYCDQQHLTPRQRLELFIPVCQAIQHAHQKGIIHRDLKPSNVLIALYDGRPVAKVIDFGVAKATNQRLTEKTMFTEFGQIVGTLEYMSPEQAELSQLDIDTRSDIYSLGVMLYELLTGTTPFEKKRVQSAAFHEILRMIREEEPPRPSTRLSTTDQLPSIAANRGTPPAKLSGVMRGELDWIVMKALDKDRSRRYETATGLARDIERYLADEPVQACPPSAAYQLRKYLRRHRGLVGAASLVLLALLLGAIGTTAGLMRAAWERSAKESADKNAAHSDKLATDARRAEVEAKAAQARAVAAKRDVRILAHLNQARLHRASGQPGQKFDCLAEIERAVKLSPSPELQLQLRNEAIAALALADLQVARTIDHIPLGSQPIFDRRFQRYALAEADGGIVVREAATGGDVLRIPPSEPLLGPTTLRLTDDGELLIATHYLKDDSLESRFIDLKSGQLTARLKGELQWLSRDRRRAVSFVTGARREIAIDELPSGQRQRTLAITPPNARTRTLSRQFLIVSPDEQELAVESGCGLKIWNLATGKLVRQHPNMNWGAWHPSGEQFVGFNQNTNQIDIIDLRSNLVLARTETQPRYVLDIKFHPRGESFLTKSLDNSIRLWSAVSGRRLLTVYGAPLWQTEFSPDGEYLGWTINGNRREIWRIDLPAACRRELQLRSTTTMFSSAQFSTDNSLFAATTGGGARLWHVDSGRQLFEAQAASWTAFERSSGDLLTLSRSGLHRWPIRREPIGNNAPSGDSITIGPPQRLRDGQESFHALAISADGRRCVASSFKNGGAALFSLTSPAEAPVPLRFFGAANVAISPDGRWAATAPYNQSAPNRPTRVWNAANGDKVHEFPLELVHGENVPVAFSGDSRWLGVSTEDACRFWRCGTWEPGPVILRQRAGGSILPARMCFSRDGRLVVLAKSSQVVSLVNPDDGQEVASFDLGAADSQVGLVGISDDKSRLAVASIDRSIFLWNLAQVRHRLRALGLDWDDEALPATPPQAVPSVVNVQRGDFDEINQAIVAKDLARTAPTVAPQSPPAGATIDEQIAFYSQAFTKDPSDVQALRARAALYLQKSDTAATLADYLAAIQLTPSDGELLFQAASLQLQRGQVRESAEQVRKLLAVQPDLYSGAQLGDWCSQLAYSYSTSTEARDQIGLIQELIQRAVELAPASANVLHRVGQAESYLEHWDDAARWLEQAQALEGNRTICTMWKDLVRVERGRGNREAAQGYLDQIKEWVQQRDAVLSPDDHTYLSSVIAQAQAEMRRPFWHMPDKATPQERIDFLSKILADDPADATALLARAAVYRQVQNIPAALADVNAALALEPNRLDALTMLGNLQISARDMPEVKKTAQQLMQFEPGEFQAYEISNALFNLAQSLLNRRLPEVGELAIELGQRGVAIQPAWDNRARLGLLFQRLERWDDSIRELEAALPGANEAGQPYYPWLYLAIAEHRRGNADKAKEILEKTRQWCAEHESKLAPHFRQFLESIRTQAEAVLKEPAGKPAGQ